jgi:hypothetical protein
MAKISIFIESKRRTACGPTNLSKTGFSKDRALGQPDQLHTWKNVRTITK